MHSRIRVRLRRHAVRDASAAAPSALEELRRRSARGAPDEARERLGGVKSEKISELLYADSFAGGHQARGSLQQLCTPVSGIGSPSRFLQGGSQRVPVDSQLCCQLPLARPRIGIEGAIDELYESLATVHRRLSRKNDERKSLGDATTIRVPGSGRSPQSAVIRLPDCTIVPWAHPLGSKPIVCRTAELASGAERHAGTALLLRRRQAWHTAGNNP